MFVSFRGAQIGRVENMDSGIRNWNRKWNQTHKEQRNSETASFSSSSYFFNETPKQLFFCNGDLLIRWKEQRRARDAVYVRLRDLTVRHIFSVRYFPREQRISCVFLYVYIIRKLQ